MTIKQMIIKSIEFGLEGVIARYLECDADSNDPSPQPVNPVIPDQTGHLPGTNRKTSDGKNWNGWITIPYTFYKDYPNHPVWHMEMDYQDGPGNQGEALVRVRLLSAPNFPVRMQVEFDETVPVEDRIMNLRDTEDRLDIYQQDIGIDGCERWYDIRKELAWRKKAERDFMPAISSFRLMTNSKINTNQKLLSPRFFIYGENIDRTQPWKNPVLILHIERRYTLKWIKPDQKTCCRLFSLSWC